MQLKCIDGNPYLYKYISSIMTNINLHLAALYGFKCLGQVNLIFSDTMQIAFHKQPKRFLVMIYRWNGIMYDTKDCFVWSHSIFFCKYCSYFEI